METILNLVPYIIYLAVVALFVENLVVKTCGEMRKLQQPLSEIVTEEALEANRKLKEDFLHSLNTQQGINRSH